MFRSLRKLRAPSSKRSQGQRPADSTASIATEYGWGRRFASDVNRVLKEVEEEDLTLVIQEWNEDRLVACAQIWGLVPRDKSLTKVQRQIAADAAKKCVVLFLLAHGAEATSHPQVFRFSWETYETCRLAMVACQPNIFAATEVPPAVAAEFDVQPRAAVASAITIFSEGDNGIVLSPTPFFCLVS
ncbi:hypothetical protein WJX72_002968 [[Myrmecia] bisecta]|uniref:Uncharacterized protein n=1 Tax=[Myrmecia] bisecta TaxID=41462 RepID=A0AAW1R595_9CHLO